MTKARDLANAGTALTSVSATELGYLDGVTSAVQTQIDAKLATSTASSTYIPKTLTTTTGDIIYASSANTPARLGIGSSAQVLTVSGGVPAWTTPAGGGGKVLQVVQATTTTATSIASTTMTDTTLSCSITPSASTSKVLVMVYQSLYLSGLDEFNAFGLNILRNSTIVLNTGNGNLSQGYRTGKPADNNNAFRLDISPVYLDSPATTSATTYKTQAAVYSTTQSRSVQAQADNETSVIILMEIGA